MKLRFSFIILAAAASFLTGCDDDKPTPAPLATSTTGTVKGTISPATAATKVYLITGTDTIKGNIATGAYEIAEVKAGTYTLAFKTADAYEAPASSTVTVAAKQTTNVPSATFTALPPNGQMSVIINGVTLTGTVSYFGGNRYPLLFDANGYPNNFTTGYNIRMELPLITGVGTYNTSVRDVNGNEVDFTVSHQHNTWWANYSMGSATVKVTSFNPTTKRISGTFNFTAWNSDDPDMIGTNGVFKNIRIFQ